MARILIVEDEPDVAEVMKMLLSSEGHKVDIALSGSEGLQKIKQAKTDLLLLDIRMPEVTGRMVLEEMKRAKIDIPVIVVTAVAGAITTKSELESKYKIDGFVSKSYLYEHLISEVKRVLKQRKKRKK